MGFYFSPFCFIKMGSYYTVAISALCHLTVLYRKHPQLLWGSSHSFFVMTVQDSAGQLLFKALRVGEVNKGGSRDRRDEEIEEIEEMKTRTGGCGDRRSQGRS